MKRKEEKRKAPARRRKAEPSRRQKAVVVSHRRDRRDEKAPALKVKYFKEHCEFCGKDVHEFIREAARALHIEERKWEREHEHPKAAAIAVHILHKEIKAIVEDAREHGVTAAHKRLFIRAVRKLHELTDRDGR